MQVSGHRYDTQVHLKLEPPQVNQSADGSTPHPLLHVCQPGATPASGPRAKGPTSLPLTQGAAMQMKQQGITVKLPGCTSLAAGSRASCPGARRERTAVPGGRGYLLSVCWTRLASET
ncbi:unnamed protein product [Lota lota]